MNALWTRAAVTLALALALFGWHADAHATTSGYLTLAGTHQGEIRGSVTTKGREGQIRVFAIAPEIKAPLDATTGQRLGPTRHKPLRITIDVDRALPLLMNAVVNNETLHRVTIRMFVPTMAGTEKNHYTIKLTNARITRFAIDSDTKDLARKGQDYLHLELTYDSIELVWEEGGIVSFADWALPSGLGASAPKPPRPKSTNEPTRKPKAKPIAKPSRRRRSS